MATRARVRYCACGCGRRIPEGSDPRKIYVDRGHKNRVLSWRRRSRDRAAPRTVEVVVCRVCPCRFLRDPWNKLYCGPECRRVARKVTREKRETK